MESDHPSDSSEVEVASDAASPAAGRPVAPVVVLMPVEFVCVFEFGLVDRSEWEEGWGWDVVGEEGKEEASRDGSRKLLADFGWWIWASN
jgi:hypothetical protein